MGKIKNPHNDNQGKSVKKPEVIEMPHHKHPIFCFKYLHKDYSTKLCTESEKKCLIDQLVMLSQLDWQQLTTTQRHGLGFEKIDKSSLKVNLPPFLTEDVSHLLAFRFDGKKPFLGHRDRFIFHIILIDRDFTAYNH